MVARHTSFFDAVIPATVLSQRNQLLAHHIVTHELRYSPCIDIVGHRFPNRFIKRTPGEGSAELGPIRDIGGLLDDRSAAIIFPEGTFRTPERFERAVRRIGRRQPDLAARASELAHVLPPRSNGTFALLQGAPTADLVVCTNTGFESFGSIKDIVTQPFTDKPIIVETWRIARADIPDDADAFSDWLFDQYVLIDEWVKAQDS
jgi:1-acyl-sn-glycerol-3-phosphate acyltransferase